MDVGGAVDEEQKKFMTKQGMPQDFVYFSKQTKKDEAKEPAKKVAWGDRFSWKKDKYRLIGMNVGLKKVVDSKGNTVNDKRVMTEFDACLERKSVV